MAAHCETDLFR